MAGDPDAVAANPMGQSPPALPNNEERPALSFADESPDTDEYLVNHVVDTYTGIPGDGIVPG